MKQKKLEMPDFVVELGIPAMPPVLPTGDGGSMKRNKPPLTLDLASPAFFASCWEIPFKLVSRFWLDHHPPGSNRQIHDRLVGNLCPYGADQV